MSAESLLPAILTSALKQGVATYVQRIASAALLPDDESRAELQLALEHYLSFVLAWSSRIHMFRMPRPMTVNQSTIPLRLVDLPRRFRTDSGSPALVTEDDLLALHRNFAVLGDPGAGKTTTLKRLADRLLSTAPSNDDDIWAYPVVVAFRDHDWSKATLARILAESFGFNLDVPPEWMGKNAWKAERIIAQFLDTGPAVLLLDGLDEVPIASRADLEKQIVNLADHLKTAKVIVSCRSGDYGHLEGFTLAEISPLTQGEIRKIAENWLGDASGFFRQLRNNPAADIADRPLFLAQLLILYQNGGGEIPDQPSALYRQVIRLMLQDWDEQRGIARHSRYAGLHVEEKLEFLSALSFELTIESRTARFGTELLERIYTEIAPQFGLPQKEASQVARDIETHTGLIVERGSDFEFSHLSLQEYLCAYHIVRQPLNFKVARYLHEYPAPVAVSVALSSDPSAWLANVVLESGVLVKAEIVRSFLVRLVQERPRFSVHSGLGYAVLKLMMYYSHDDRTPFVVLLQNSQVQTSVTMALSSYRLRVDGDETRLAYRDIERSFRGPREGGIANRLFDLIAPEAG